MLDTLMQSGSNQVSGAMLDTLFVCALYKTRYELVRINKRNMLHRNTSRKRVHPELSRLV